MGGDRCPNGADRHPVGAFAESGKVWFAPLDQRLLALSQKRGDSGRFLLAS